MSPQSYLSYPGPPPIPPLPGPLLLARNIAGPSSTIACRTAVLNAGGYNRDADMICGPAVV